MKKRLQVFISSTFKDLIVERQAAVSAVLKLGHIPAGMELFTANDKSQWETIKRWIDESDVYMLILGGRYGTVEPTSKLSYTELEYDYAVKTNKPLFAVVINSEALEKKIREFGTDFSEKENPKELGFFKSKVLSNMSSFFDDIKDIKLCVMESLPQINSEYELSGWIPGNDVPDTKTLVDEISSLKKENFEIRSQLDKAKRDGDNFKSNIEDEFGELKSLLTAQYYLTPFEIEGKFDNDLYSIFLMCWGDLILGVPEYYGDVDSKFIYSTICPVLLIHDLVSLITLQDRRGKHFMLTDKGKKFALYAQKQSLTQSK